MLRTVRPSLKLLPTTLFLLLSACAQQAPQPVETMRVCDDTGCADRPKN
jgi:hypothetical protein